MREKFPKYGIFDFAVHFDGGSMIGIVRYLKGYVKIKVWGYSPERFMNLCTNRHIVLWGVTGCNGCYTMYLCLSDFFALKDIVRKTKTRVAVLERHGLPFLMQDVRKRKMFAAGILFCLFFLMIMSRFVWAIELEGNLMVTDDELFNFLKAQGVSYGVSKSSLNLEELEAAIREEFSQVTWTSARLDGTRITVQIKENDLPTREERSLDAQKYEDGADLTALKPGTVASILTRAGVPQVKEGDTVEKGTLLVSGLVPVKNDDGTVREWLRRVSDADIMIQCEEEVHLTQQLAYQYKNYTGREKIYHFFTLGGQSYRFPFGKCSFVSFDEIVEERRLRIFGQIDLPVETGTICCREYLPVDAMYDEENAAALLNNRLEKIIGQMEEKGVQIIQKDVKIVRKANALVMQGKLTVLEEAVTLQPIDEARTETFIP